MTGFWKADQILFHFIGSANNYTHTLPIHNGITKPIGWLVCFSRANFANYVQSQIRQWGSWRALHERHGSENDPSGSETSLRSSRPMHMASISLTHRYFNSPNRRYNLPLAAHCPLLPTSSPSCLPTLLYMSLMIIQSLWKGCSKSSGGSYIAS